MFSDVGEVYLCECGALIDIGAEKNFCEPFEPMTAEEIEQLGRDLVNDRIERIFVDAAAVLDNYKMKRPV